MPEGNDGITVVVFRKWRHGDHDILALFPEVAATMEGHCLSYEHLGQHGGADYAGCIRQTRPAKAAEYADLKEELENHYGYTLRVARRGTRAAHDKRMKEARGGT